MLIFIAGVHGVGKGYLCENYAINNRVLHKSASQLIKEYGDIELSIEKLTVDIDHNQLILLTALDDLRHKKETILLDGHFALVSKNGVIKKIDIDIFRTLKIDGVILIKNDIEVIIQRVLNRDGNRPSYDLNQLMIIENLNAYAVCEALKIPIKELTAPTLGDFIKAVEEVGREIKSGAKKN